jgi:hypothetical protein
MDKMRVHKSIGVLLFIVVSLVWAQDPDSSWTQTYEQADFDSLNVRFIGGWPFGDSYAVAYDATRQLAFLGSGGGVYILDVSNPSTPTKLSEKIHTQGFVMGLFYDSALQRLYITAEVIGLEIWDVSNPYAPVKLGHCDTPGWARCVFVSGSYAYIADHALDYRGGLRVIDISTPSNPHEVGFYETPGYAEGVFILGTYAYVADGFSGLRVIDISTPSNPQEVGYCDTPDYAIGVHVSGPYAYVADREAGLRVIDISTPSSPQEVGYCDTPDCACRVYVSGSYAYVADRTAGMRVIDISTPSSPQEVGYFDPSNSVWDVFVSGPRAYVANHISGLRILDISTPSNPREIGSFDARSSALDVHISGSYAYVADRGAGLRVIDISTPSNPYEVGNCDTPSEAYGIFVSGYCAYIADYEGGLRVIDISTPSSPQEVGYCYTPSNTRDVFVSGSYAYVADRYSGLRVIDVSTPSNPQEVGFCDTPGEAYGVFVSGSYAYVADRTAGMRVIDISTPSNPQEVGYCSTPDEAWGLYISGSYAYVADHDAGLRVIDVSTPSNPHEVGYCETPGYALNVYIYGYYAYVADNLRGLRVIDISTSSNPQEVGYYDTYYYPHNSFGVAVSEDYVFIGAYKTGLHVYENLLLHLGTDDPHALAYNGNKHLAREPNTDNLHLVYTNGGYVIYTYSGDGGKNWTMAENIEEGEFPAICLDRHMNPCVISTTVSGKLCFSKKSAGQGWTTTVYSFGTSRPSHPSIAVTTPDEIDIDSAHILVRLLQSGPFQNNLISEIVFPITDPQDYQILPIESSAGINMITLDFPSIARDFTNTLHATWMHGDTVYYGTRPEGQNWNVWDDPFNPEGRNSAHPFVETYGDSIFVVWQNESDEEVYRGARHLFWPFSWENLSQTFTTPSIYPVNASGMVTTFVDKSSALSEYDVFWKSAPDAPLHNLSNTSRTKSMFPHASLQIIEEQEPPIQYSVWLEGNEAPYEIKFAKTQIMPDRGTQSSSAYFTSIPGDAIPTLYLVERDSFIANWQIPVDIGVQRVKYEFPLVPPYSYKAKIIAYHEFQGQRQMRVNIDGGINATVNYNAAHPETLELWIPPALYEDSMVTVELQGINAGLTVGPIYIYRYECGSGGKISGGPMTQDNQSSSASSFAITPNPFNEKLDIRCQMADVSQKISLKVYDVTGRLVKDIYKGLMRGTNMLTWNGEDENGRPVAQGIYFIRVENLDSGETLCKKVLRIE